jgi:hypothetical protein
MGWDHLFFTSGSSKFVNFLTSIILFTESRKDMINIGLFGYGLKHKTATAFDKLDACTDSMIYVGAALLGWGVVELFGKKKK